LQLVNVFSAEPINTSSTDPTSSQSSDEAIAVSRLSEEPGTPSSSEAAKEVSPTDSPNPKEVNKESVSSTQIFKYPATLT
jgi:hypothetical protein